jgi:carboxypeptidase Q
MNSVDDGQSRTPIHQSKIINHQSFRAADVLLTSSVRMIPKGLTSMIITQRYISKRLLAVVLAGIFVIQAVPAIAAGPKPVDLEMVTRIRQEGFRNSRVMETMSELTDRIGPRLTGSPSMKKANEWTRDQLTAFGLVNAHLEKFGPFGRGWSYDSATLRMISPAVAQLYAIPKAWSVGTSGPVRAGVIKVKIEKKEDFEQYRGKLAGMIVFNGDQHDAKPSQDPLFTRLTDQRLTEIAAYQVPGERSSYSPEAIARRFGFQRELNKFLEEEKVVALIDCSRSDNAIFVAGGGAYKPGDPAGVPSVVLAHDQYGRIQRLLDRQVPVEVELDLKTRFYDDDPDAYNTIAELPGTDKKDQVVMAGAHLDSWHGGTGATDNAAGVAVVMEAVRILKALGVKPRRTIRVGLWAGEEQGLLGSRAYVQEHLASAPEPTDPKEKELPTYVRRPTGPLTLKPEQAKLSGYFNIDNGTGKLRGIFLQENAAVRPIFEAWLEPFRDLGFNTISMRNTGGTDHQAFDGVGVPGFQFIQDPIEYQTRTHHSNLDVYERIQREDLMQASVVLASFLYHAAMRDQMLPRKPVPDPANRATMPGSEHPANIPIRRGQ